MDKDQRNPDWDEDEHDFDYRQPFEDENLHDHQPAHEVTPPPPPLINDEVFQPLGNPGVPPPRSDQHVLFVKQLDGLVMRCWF